MKILTRKEFVEMPAGTVFSTYEPCVFRGLYIKHDTWKFDGGGSDFIEARLFGEFDAQHSDEYFEFCKRMETGEDIPQSFEETSREGLFDDNMMYAVFSKEDVENLIKTLQASLTQ